MQAAAEIEREMVSLHEDSYEAGVAHARAYVLDHVVLVILDVELTPAEQALYDYGATDEIRQTREAFENAIGPSLIALVERATGREVDSFMSHMHMDPIYSVELFRLKK